MTSEYEFIDHPQIRYLKSFLVNIEYRNPHVHNSFELCMVLTGSIQVTSRQVRHIFAKDQIFIFNPAQPHELKAIGEGVVILSIQLSYSLFFNYYPLIQNIVFTSENINDCLPAEAAGSIRTLMLEISYEYFARKEFYEFRCICLTNALMNCILKYVPYKVLDKAEARSANNRNMRLKRIVDYIENNYTGKLLLSDIAGTENLSLCYLSHFFKDNFNMTFQAYLNNLRFERARQLLLKTDMRIIDICMESGFSDTKYLNKMFLDTYGCTPKDYRQATHMHESLLSRDESASVQKFYSDAACLAIISKYHREIFPFAF